MSGNKLIDGLIGVGAIVVGFVLAPISGGASMAMFSIGLSLLQSALTPSALAAQQYSMQQNVLDPAHSLPVVYGTDKIGVALAEFRVTGDNAEHLYAVACFCHGSRNGKGIELIGDLYFDGRTLAAQRANGTWNHPYASASGLTKVINRHNGLGAPFTDTMMNAAFPVEWPITSVGSYVAYIALHFAPYMQDVFPSGLPDITCDIQGMRVYDPRNSTGGPDLDGYIYSTNPALCTLDYLQGFYGCKVPLAEIDVASFITAANMCDVPVSVPGTPSSQKTFEMNGWADTSRPPVDNLLEMLASFRAMMVYDGGLFRLIIRDTSSTSGLFAVTRENVVGGWKFRTQGKEDAPNLAVFSYVDPKKNNAVQETQFPDLGVTNTFLAEDNGQDSKLEISLRFTKNPYMGQQIAMVLLKEARFSKPFQVNVKASILTQRVGDLVSITHDVPGWVNQPAWILSLGILPGEEALVQLTGMTYDPNMYVLDAQVVVPALVATTLPDPFTCQPVTNLQAFTGTKDLRVKITWSPSPDPYLNYYLIQAKRTSPVATADPDYITVGRYLPGELSAYIPTTASGDQWSIRMCAVNTNEAKSSFATVTHTVTLVSTAAFTVNAVVQAASIDYDITFGTDCEFVEAFTIENTGASGANPIETTEYSAGYVMRTQGATVRKSIATATGAYRRTLFVGYTKNWEPGQRTQDGDRQAASTGGGPSGAPTWAATPYTSITQTTIDLDINLADGTATTRIYQDGVIVRTLAAGVTDPQMTGLTASTTYVFDMDHVKNGIASAKAGTRSITTPNPGTAPATFTEVSCLLYVYGLKTYKKFTFNVAGATAGTHEVYESTVNTAGTGYQVAVTDGSGDVTREMLEGAPGSFYYFARQISPVSDWVALDVNPETYIGACA